MNLCYFTRLIHRSINQLQSLTIDSIVSIQHFHILSNLSSLPRLYSLTIDTQSQFDDIKQLYQLVLPLPKLKYFKCDADIQTFCYLPPVTDAKQLSSIEYLVCYHACTVNEISTILPYLPKLCHLSFRKSDDDDDDEHIEGISSNLTHLHIDSDIVLFDHLRMFINEKLRVLSLDVVYEDMEYFDAYRWESFLSNYVPNLKEFYFTYGTYYGDDDDQLVLPTGFRNQFNSAFF